MLCLLTLVDVEAVNPETLTPWREELLWRLYVDTYNHLTLEYADERIEHQESGLRALSPAARTMSRKPRSRGSSRVCPAGICQLFPHEAIYRHVRLSRDIRSGRRPRRSRAQGIAVELTVVTLDKPFLFSNICGALSSFGMDIARGHAMTNPNGLVAGRLPVHGSGAIPRAQRARGKEQFLTVLGAVISGATDVTERLRAPGAERLVPAARRRHRDSHR